jgi:dTDP-4-amino-4,6-dideoxygalactose transaminase
MPFSLAGPKSGLSPSDRDAIYALHNGRSAGSFGTIGCLSFSVPKIVTTGQRGTVVTNDQTLADHAHAFIDHGDREWRRANLNRAVGTNLRLNDVMAALGLAQLDTLTERLARKRRAYLRYARRSRQHCVYRSSLDAGRNTACARRSASPGSIGSWPSLATIFSISTVQPESRRL